MSVEPTEPAHALDKAQEQEAEPPPVLGTWRNVYALVTVALLLCVVLLYALGRWAA